MITSNLPSTNYLDSNLLKQKIEILTNTLKLGLLERNLYLKKFLHKLTSTEDTTINWDQCVNLTANFNLTNILEQWFAKTQLQQILLHPLVPSDLAQYFFTKGQIWVAELDRTSLHWTTSSLQELLTDQNLTPDIAIFAAPHGLFKEILENTAFLKQVNPNLQILVYLPNTKPSLELLTLIQSPEIDYFVWELGSHILQAEFSGLFSQDQLAGYNIFLAWQKLDFIQVKTVQSSNSVLPNRKEMFLQAYLFWLLETYKKQKPLAGFWLQTITQWLYLNTKFNSYQEALEVMNSVLDEFLQAQVPDVFFFQKEPPQINWQAKVSPKRLYQTIGQQIARLPSGSTEVPSLFLDRPYIRYFFYSKEYPFWQRFFTTKGFVIQPIEIAGPLLDYHNSVESLDFISKYGIWIDLLDTSSNTVN